MTTRRKTTKLTDSSSSQEQHNTEVIMSSVPTQDELENFFNDATAQEELTYEPPALKKKRVRPPKTGKVFLGEEDVRHFEAYKKFLKDEQGIKKINHKPI